MAYSFNGTSDYIVSLSDSVTGGATATFPISISCWFYANVGATAQGLLTMSSSANARNIHLEYGSDDLIYARTRSGADSPAITTTTANPNTWNHVLGVWNGTASSPTTSRSVYLNGGAKGTNNTSVASMGLQNAIINIGSRFTPLATRSRYLNGNIAEVAVWNESLTDDNALQLATGINPLKIRPDKLIVYFPLIRENIIPLNEKIEWAGGVDYLQPTIVGAIPANTHPRRYG